MADMSKKINLLRDLPFKVVTLVLLIAAMLPAYRSTYALPTMAVAEMIFAFIFFPGFYKTFCRIFIPLLAYSLLCFFIATPFDLKMGFIHPFMSQWIWIFPIVMASELIRCKSFDTNRFIYFASITVLMIIITATFKALGENPFAMREMTAGIDEEYVAMLIRMNVGSFGIAYGCGVVLTALVGCLLIYRMSSFNKLFALVFAAVLATLVIMAQFTTLLIITVGVICYQLVVYSKSPLFKICIALIGAALFIFGKDILGAIIEYFDGTVTAFHLQEIYDSLFEDVEYDNTRRKYLGQAIDLFFNSPIWGNDVTTEFNEMIVYESHSTVLTVLCKTGILGLWAYLAAYWQAFKPIFKAWDVKTRKIIGNGLIIYFLLLAYLNPAENDIFSFCLGLVSILTVYYFSNTQTRHVIRNQ